MKDKGHFYISMLKSGIRILACILGLTGDIVFLAGGFIVAEVLGIAEEVFDKR